MTRFGIEALQERVKAAVEAEGMRPFARRAGVGLGVVRSMAEGRDPSFSNALALATALDLDLGFAPLEAAVPLSRVDDTDFAKVPLHEAWLAAGTGISNATEEVIDHLAFRRDWLKRIGVQAASARLARIRGESMQPTIWADDMVLINTQDTLPMVRPKETRDQRRLPIYALIDNGEARAKRLERPSPDLLMMISDNPDFPPELRQGPDLQAVQIIGKVVWWGHTVKE